MLEGSRAQEGQRPQSSPAAPLPGLGQGNVGEESPGGGPGAGRNSPGGWAEGVTQEGERAWLQAHHSASCLPQARNPGGLSSPLPACWVNIVISPCCLPGTAWPCAAQGHRAGGRQGYGEVTCCLEDDSGLEGCRRYGQEPGAPKQPHLHHPQPAQRQGHRPRNPTMLELDRCLIKTCVLLPPSGGIHGGQEWAGVCPRPQVTLWLKEDQSPIC